MGGSWREASPLPHDGENLSIEVRADGAAIVLALQGELDVAGRARFSVALEEAMAASQEPIVLEVGRLAFMDGGSAGLIARTRRELRAQGRELTLSHPQRQVRRVIELCAALAGPREDLDRNPISVPRLPRAEALAVGP